MAYPNSTALLTTLVAVLSLLISPSFCSNALYSALGGNLAVDQSLVYRDYTLIMQGDCNLVLYANHTPIWHTNTYHKATNCYLNLQPNGELILFGDNSLSIPVPIWRSGVTSQVGNYCLVVKYDGSLHVYGPSIWTNPESASGLLTTTHKSSSPLTIDSTLWSGDVAPIGVTIANNEYVLELLDKCNLTLSDTKSGKVLWSTDTEDVLLQDCYVNIEGSGEFTIKHLGGAIFWRNNVTSSWADYVLALQPDGKLAVYGPTIWSTVNSKLAESHEEKIAMVTAE